MKRGLLESAKRIMAPRSLRYQLLSRSLFILAGLLVLIGSFQYVLMKDFLYRQEAETLSVQTRGLPRDLLERTGLLTEPAHEDDRYLSNDKGRDKGPLVFLPETSIAYIRTDNHLIDLSLDSGIAAPRLSDAEYASIRTRLAYRKRVEYKVVRNAQGVEQIIVFRPADGPRSLQGMMQMGTDTHHLKTVLMRQLLIFAILVILALAGGLAFYLPVLRRTLGPLNRMVRTVRQIDAGKLDERFPVSQGQLEIDLLAHSFNGMLERLETSFEAEREAKEQMRRFIADASHELRTPLTSVHGFLEVLLRGAADKREQLYAALHSMLGESTRMKKLVQDLLTLAKLDRAPELHMTETRLDRLIEEMEPHLRMLAGDRKIHFALAAGIGGMYDPDKLKQVVLNLFQNAVQYTDSENGEITISLTSDGKWANITVRDNGSGIAEKHLPHLFERFYRIDSSRTRKHGGAGLGLSISQSIVEAHGGRMMVDSRPGAGSTFTVVLPKAWK